MGEFNPLNDTIAPNRDCSEDVPMRLDFVKEFRKEVTPEFKAQREPEQNSKAREQAHDGGRALDAVACMPSAWTRAHGRSSARRSCLFNVAKSICSNCPERFSLYVIATALAGKLISAPKPPAYPEELRKVKAKRTKAAPEGNENNATWVASHLCHNRRCVNAEHLVWEPSWMNRLRDNCPRGDACVHRPDRCLAPHRAAEAELIDWTAYLLGEYLSVFGV